MDNNTASNNSTSPLGSFPRVNGGKRRLCVIALNPFWERIKQDERTKSAVTVERLRERKVKLDNLQQIPIEKFVSGNIDEHNADTRIDISNNSLETCTSSSIINHRNSGENSASEREEWNDNLNILQQTAEVLNDNGKTEYVSSIRKTTFISNGNSNIVHPPNLKSTRLIENNIVPLLNTSLPIVGNRRSRTIQSFASTHKHIKYQDSIGDSPKFKPQQIERDAESFLSLEEKLRRERQRLNSCGVTQFSWGHVYSSFEIDNSNRFTTSTIKGNERDMKPLNTTIDERVDPLGIMSTPKNLGKKNERSSPSKHSCDRHSPCEFHGDRQKFSNSESKLRILVPYRGNIYVQDGIGCHNSVRSPLRLLYEKSMLEEVLYKRDMTIDIDGVTERARKSSKIKMKPSFKNQQRTTGSAVGRDASAIDPQLSPDGTMVAFVVASEIYVISCVEGFVDTQCDDREQQNEEKRGNDSFVHGNLPIRITFGAISEQNSDHFDDDLSLSSSKVDDLDDDHFSTETKQNFKKDMTTKKAEITVERRRHGRSITNGMADFVAQEEMDRYRGFWWDSLSRGILFARVDESCVPPYRINHQGKDGSTNDENMYEDHRYPFAGKANPDVTLCYVSVDRNTILSSISDEPIKDYRVDGDEDIKRDYNVKGALSKISHPQSKNSVDEESEHVCSTASFAASKASANWSNSKSFKPPSEASEYLARVSWLQDGTVCAQWQNRDQSIVVLQQINVDTGESTIIHKEQSAVWINLHHMFWPLPRPIHSDECISSRKEVSSPPLPDGSFSFLFASERTGFCHLYLYTYVPNGHPAKLIRAISGGNWMVDNISGVDINNNIVYFTGTYDSSLERHLYALPIIYPNRKSEDRMCSTQSDTCDSYSGTRSMRRGLKHVMNSLSGGASISKYSIESSREKQENNKDESHDVILVMKDQPPNPIRFTTDPGMHNIVMDDTCRFVVDTSSDLTRPMSTKLYYIPYGRIFTPLDTKNFDSANKDRVLGSYKNQICTRDLRRLFVIHDAFTDGRRPTCSTKNEVDANAYFGFPAPEIVSFPTSDGTEILYASLYRPNPAIHGPGPYPLICSAYGGPHVQRISRSWCQSADMRAQRLCSLGFAVFKCDNRGSARRGLIFESSIRNNLGRLEVLDQVAAVRFFVVKGIADSSRVGIYGWSYGGYLAAMCLCRAPDVFHVAVAGAPVTSWDGYDTHYTERYMGLPSENSHGYNESAVFEHVPQMCGKLFIIHGLIDENVHFRHTARLINRLIAAGKDYDLLIFPDERHSPRRLRDRIYMERRISDYFIKNLLPLERINPRVKNGRMNNIVRPVSGHL